MPAAGQNFSLYRGEQLSAKIAFTDEASAPTTLTAGRLTIGPYFDSRRSLFSWKTGTSELSLVNIDGTNDGLQLTLTAQQTRGLQAGRYAFWARGKPASGSQIGAVGTITVLETADAMAAPL